MLQTTRVPVIALTDLFHYPILLSPSGEEVEYRQKLRFYISTTTHHAIKHTALPNKPGGGDTGRVGTVEPYFTVSTGAITGNTAYKNYTVIGKYSK